MRQITVLSLFDGISCARVALDRLGYTDVLYLASEVDKYASAITRHQWPDTIHLGDITQIKRENLPVQIDLLIGGSPCQDLSIAKNNRKGLEGERSGLFWEWVRLWRECKPTWWVLENVNSMPKEAKRIISETLGVEPIMINAALVSAQNRKRLFWTNIKTDIFGNCHIPQPEDRGILLKHILETGSGTADKSHPINATYWKAGTSPAAQDYSDRTHQRTLIAESVENGDKSYAIPSTYYKENIKSLDQRKKTGLIVKDNIYLSGGQNGNVYDTEGKSPTLSAGTGIAGRGIGSSNAPKVAEPVFVAGIGENGDKSYAIPEATKDDGKTPTLTTAYARSGSSKEFLSMQKSVANALEGYTIRKLTPVECERLMTLPTWEIITEVEICSDLAKNYVNAVNKSPKLQKLVGSVEKIELQQYVEYVGRKLRENNPKTEHIVQENATTQTMNSALNHTENRKTELPMCAKYVGKNSRCPNPVVEEDIVLWNAFISITGGPSAPNGGEVSLLRERHYVTRLNGNKSLRLSGNEIMQLAKDVENGSITKRDNNTTYITLSRLGIKNIELMLIILYYYAVIAIDGCMEKEIRTNYLSMRCYNPYTANGVNVNGKHIAISNTQRYKCLGNGFVVEVVAHILSYMEES